MLNVNSEANSLKQHYVESSILCSLVPSTVSECNKKMLQTEIPGLLLFDRRNVVVNTNKTQYVKTMWCVENCDPTISLKLQGAETISILL